VVDDVLVVDVVGEAGVQDGGGDGLALLAETRADGADGGGVARQQPDDVVLAPASLNGGLAVVGMAIVDGVATADSAVVVEGDGDRVWRVFIVRHPAKLGTVAPRSG
jgi:hypothetical protein